MPAQPDPTARNREAQRRSRARLKEHVEELKNRLYASEREKTKATAEVQAAAGRVADVNGALRSLLQERGVTTDDIACYVHEFLSQGGVERPVRKLKDRNSDGIVDKTQPKVVNPPDISADGEATGMTAIQGHSTRIWSDESTSRDPSHLNLPKGHTVTPCESSSTASLAITAGPEPAATMTQPSSGVLIAGDFIQPLIQPKAPCAPCESDADEISCIDAAQILARLRGHDNDQSLWPELGCSLEHLCMVKRSRVLELASCPSKLLWSLSRVFCGQ